MPILCLFSSGRPLPGMKQSCLIVFYNSGKSIALRFSREMCYLFGDFLLYYGAFLSNVSFHGFRFDLVIIIIYMDYEFLLCVCIRLSVTVLYLCSIAF